MSTLAAVLARLGLDAYADVLAPYAKLETGLVHAGDPGPAAGTSRIGGAPDLPPDFTWPTRRWPIAEVPTWPDFIRELVTAALDRGQAHATGEELVTPTAFLLQLNLADLAEQRLPPRGLLSFFVSVTSDI